MGSLLINIGLSTTYMHNLEEFLDITINGFVEPSSWSSLAIKFLHKSIHMFCLKHDFPSTLQFHYFITIQWGRQIKFFHKEGLKKRCCYLFSWKDWAFIVNSLYIFFGRVWCQVMEAMYWNLHRLCPFGYSFWFDWIFSLLGFWALKYSLDLFWGFAFRFGNEKYNEDRAWIREALSNEQELHWYMPILQEMTRRS